MPDLPEPDLLIRTSGEQRISNFMLWQFAYTEMFFSNTYWPDFDAEAFQLAIDFYYSKQRRFGRRRNKLSLNMLKHRTWTALVLLLLIIGMIFILKPPFFAIAMVLFLIASAWEWAKLIGLHSWYSQLAYIILILLSLYLTHFISLWWLLLSSFFLWLWARVRVPLCSRI